MSRPDVSVVMPFAGDAASARAAACTLRSLDVRPGDELILVDNSGIDAAASLAVKPVPDIDAGDRPEVKVLTAPGERSPARARNVGATQARKEWVLFLDADTSPRQGLLDAFFVEEIPTDVGAVAGEVVPAVEAGTLAARYGSARNFLGQRAHYEHPYRPRAAAANLLVRRAAFEQLGGFYEGVRAAEDTDFSWRLQEAGWRLELRGGAVVRHHYRTTLAELRRQWRGYAAGRAWLARRYEDFEPQPAVRRALRRASARVRPRASRDGVDSDRRSRGAAPTQVGALERSRYLALDALLSLEELAGLTLSNRPRADADRRSEAVDVVLVADRFPTRGDPLVELARTLGRVRVEAAGRPEAPDRGTGDRLIVDYLEDDGAAARLIAAASLALRHPLRCALDLLERGPDAPPLRVLAPAALRLERDRGARLHLLGTGVAQEIGGRLARLAGRSLDR